jgi:Domain of unknown function (DUF4349)
MSATDAISNERLDALLRGDRPRTSGEERRAALLDGLRSARLQAPDALRSRVLATKPERSRVPRFALPTRRLVLVVVPAAAMVAVGAALVHGLVGSSGKTDTPLAAVSQVQRKTWHAAGGSSTATGSYRALAPTATPGRLQHTAASLVVRVPDVDTLSQATSAATKIATSLGGYAQSVVYSTPQLDSGAVGGSSAIELRIPAQNVKTALARLAALGTLVSQQVSVQDLQHAFAVQTAQIGQLRRSIAALRLALRDPALPDAQRVLLKIRLAEQQRALAQRLHARTGTVAAGTTARVSLVLNTADAVVPVPTHRGRLGRMVHSAIGFLALEATVALYVLIVIGPFVLLAALAWGLNRARRRRDERRLLAT